MRIGEVADRAGVSAKTIRFWEGEGLVPAPGRTESGYRQYDSGAVDRLAFIRRAQVSGLTLAQIRQILEVADDGGAPCEHVGRVVAERLADVDRRLAELAETRRQLQRLARRAAVQDPADCDGYCTIIAG